MKEKGRKQIGGVGSPCAACKLLRRRCCRDCIFAPYFPADEPHKFASVHKVFGASNVSKMLQELPEQRRSDAVSAMVYEANARVRDPVYGCVGAISSLQRQVDVLQAQLALAQAQLVQLRMPTNPNPAAPNHFHLHNACSCSSTPAHHPPLIETSSSSRSSPMAMDDVVNIILDHHDSLWSY